MGYSNGVRSDYTGGRTKDTIVNWVSKKSGPSSDPITCDEIVSKTAEKKLNAVYFGDLVGDLHTTFLEVASKYDDVSFYHAPADCASAHGAAAPGVSFFRTFEESPLKFDGKGEELENFVSSSSLPTLIEFADEYVEPIFGKGAKAIILFTDDKNIQALSIFEEAAKALKGEVLFVQSGTKDGI